MKTIVLFSGKQNVSEFFITCPDFLENHNALSRVGLWKLQHFCQQHKVSRRISAPWSLILYCAPRYQLWPSFPGLYLTKMLHFWNLSSGQESTFQISNFTSMIIFWLYSSCSNTLRIMVRDIAGGNLSWQLCLIFKPAYLLEGWLPLVKGPLYCVGPPLIGQFWEGQKGQLQEASCF